MSGPPARLAKTGHSARAVRSIRRDCKTRRVVLAQIGSGGKAIVLTLRGRWHAHWAERNTAAACPAWRSCIRCCHDRSGPASSRRGFVPAGDSLQPPVERLVRVTFLVEQRPEKTMAQRCLDLRLRPKEWPFGERMGSSKGCAVAELQVSEVSQRSAVFRGYVRIYSSDQCPRQDSNLRSRLWRLLPCIALACQNVLAEILPGRV